MKLKQKRGLIIGAAVAGVLTTAGGALASIPRSDGVISSCYDGTGAVKVIDEATTASCPAGSTPLKWNMQGRTGPTGPQGPRGQSGDNRAFWIHLGPNGEDLGHSGPGVMGGSGGTGYYWIIPDKTYAQDVRKCSITATPAASYGAFPIEASVYYVGQYYAYVELKQIKKDVWPLAFADVNSEVFINVNCGQTQ